MYMTKRTALLKLAWANFSRRKRSTIIAIVLSFVAVFAIVLTGSACLRINSGLELSSQRMGADVVIYPEAATIDDSELIFSGVAQMVYMDKSVIDGKLPEEDIECITPQFFLQTLPGADCCDTSEEFRIVGVDPQTDFLLSSWYDVTQWQDDELLIGANVSWQEGMDMFLLGNVFHIVDRLPWTGSGMDDSIYINIEQSRSIGLHRFSQEDYHYFDEGTDLSQLVTCYLIQLKSGVDPEAFVDEAKANGLEAQIVAVSATRSQLKSQMSVFTKMLLWVAALVVAVCILAMYAFYANNFGNRGREIGYLRSLGLSRRDVVWLILVESGFSAGAGGILGAAAGTLALTPLMELLQKLLVIPQNGGGAGTVVVTLLAGAGLSLIVGWLTAAVPAWNCARLEPAAAITEGES